MKIFPKGIFFGLACAAALASCAKPRMETDFDSAKRSAGKSGRDILLLATADWSDGDPYGELFSAKEFINEHGKKYVILSVRLLEEEVESAIADTSEMSDEEHKAWLELQERTAADKYFLKRYGVRNFPDAFILSAEGYFLSRLNFDDCPEITAEEFQKRLASAEEESQALRPILAEMRSAEGVEKARAADRLICAVPEEFNASMRDLAMQVPSLDPQNESGLSGKYELVSAYYVSLDEMMAGREPDLPFVKAAESPNLTPVQKQEAWYMAAYTVLNNTLDLDYDKIILYLQNSYDADPAGATSGEVLQTLENLKKFNQISKAGGEQ